MRNNGVEDQSLPRVIRMESAWVRTSVAIVKYNTKRVLKYPRITQVRQVIVCEKSVTHVTHTCTCSLYLGGVTMGDG